jgi:ABC-type glycerol-3-phosphate transport system substrate-binding protein
MSRAFRFFAVFGLLLSAGCSVLPDLPFLSTPTPVPVIQATATTEIIPTQTAPSEPQARILRVWLPPRFDLNAETNASNLLRQRFAEFEAQRPGLKIEVRIKAEDGDSGLLNSLVLTSNAAPAALPDLVALPRPALETAAQKGLLHPIDGLSTALQSPDWYPYARDLGLVQNIGYGLPFAGEAMVLLYRSELDGDITWNTIFSGKHNLSFPAGDPQALLALSLYISAGGELVDANGKPTLNQDVLTRVLTWVKQGVESGVILPSVKNIATYDYATSAYRSGSSDMAITWTNGLPVGLVSPVPGLDDSSHSFAIGWAWTLAGANPENQQIAIQLAEFLTADDFIIDWTREAGYLPTRPSSVLVKDSAVAHVAESAYVMPSDDVVEVLGPILQDAVVRVLNGEQPESVAVSALEKLK